MDAEFCRIFVSYLSIENIKKINQKNLHKKKTTLGTYILQSTFHIMLVVPTASYLYL